MSEAIDETEEIKPRKPSFWRRWRRDPLLPEAGAGGAPLTAVIAVISFLAVISMAAVLIIDQSSRRWMADLRAEITIQVKGADNNAIKEGAQTVMRILQETNGVLEAELVSKEETEALLEPWLGKNNAGVFLNVPAIIEVRADPVLRDNLAPLQERLALEVPGASIDSHSAWHDRLATAAQSGQALAFFIFALVMGAACAISMFAARAGLSANKDVVAVLHLVGATDEFIAAEVQRRFFILGLRGAGLGFIAALGTLGTIAFLLSAGIGADSFLPQFTIGGHMALFLLAVPLVTCLVTALTARVAVIRSLREQF